jgi:hypothetical protein
MPVWGTARKKALEVVFREPRGREEIIHTREGDVRAKKGQDFVICGVKGELYPVDIDIFNETFDVVKPLICTLCGHPKGSAREQYGNCNCSCHRGG